MAVNRGGCPFGGTPGATMSLSPGNSPPSRGYRVIPGAVWWRLIYWPWRQYLVARSAGMLNITPPLLAPLITTSVFFTDQDSLKGIQDPAGFARRVGLSLQAQTECQRFGCAVIQFDAPNDAVKPLPYPGVQQGLTVGGGREWKTLQNIPLNADSMTVVYIDIDNSGPRWFDLPL